MWIKAYHRSDSFVCTKDSYICRLHFVGGNGPTNPDPISAVASKEMVRLSICAFITLFVERVFRVKIKRANFLQY